MSYKTAIKLCLISPINNVSEANLLRSILPAQVDEELNEFECENGYRQQIKSDKSAKFDSALFS